MRDLRFRVSGVTLVSAIAFLGLLLVGRNAWAPTEELYGNYNFLLLRTGTGEIGRLTVTNTSSRRLLVRGGIRTEDGTVLAQFMPNTIMDPGETVELDAPGQGGGLQRLGLIAAVAFFGPRGAGSLPPGGRPVAGFAVVQLDGTPVGTAQYFLDSAF
jgi:hypothetical protein